MKFNTHWAQNIINAHVSYAEVSGLEILSVNIGTTTHHKIQVNHSATDVLPVNWFVKTPSQFLKSRIITAIPGLLRKEAYFYQSLSKQIPLLLPPVLAAQTPFGTGSTLVMSDLAELGFTPGHPRDALTFQQAQRVIEDLAKFHSHFWDKHDLPKTYGWLTNFNANAENQLGSLLAVPLMKRGLHLAEKHIPGKLHKPALHYAANRRKVMKFLANGRQTLVHHDCHPGNLFWKQHQPGFLDWQLVRMGEGIGDVAYFMATSLKPDLRRQHEQQLLELYLNALQQHGVTDLSAQDLYQRYRAHLSYALEAMVVTLAIGDMMDEKSNLELIKRTASAVEDHDSFSAIRY